MKESLTLHRQLSKEMFAIFCDVCHHDAQDDDDVRDADDKEEAKEMEPQEGLPQAQEDERQQEEHRQQEELPSEKGGTFTVEC